MLGLDPNQFPPCRLMNRLSIEASRQYHCAWLLTACDTFVRLNPGEKAILDLYCESIEVRGFYRHCRGGDFILETWGGF